LRASVAPGKALLSSIKRFTAASDKSVTLDFFDTYGLQQSLRSFETVLTAEMNVSDIYLVTKKRGYDTPDLINQAETLFPAELLLKVPESIDDIRQAGKCIAFELGTAAGFHTMRAMEIVLRQYWDVVTSGADRPKTGNMGDYLRELESKNAGDPKTRATLKQIKDLHRNELMHPEENLSIDDVIALLGIAQSAIIAMLREIPDVAALGAGV
jgi:hypothetical protein